MLLTKHNFIAWLTARGYVPVSDMPDTYEKGDFRYTARIQSGGMRHRLSPNRWSAEKTFRYNRRFINKDGKLDWLS